ncbi:hypothetical protein EC991_001713 [Linnemannia zychae]|nr:hypothetical protein EC991_001713 [Linnemannia zychae]
MANLKTSNSGPATKAEVPAVNPYQAFVAAIDPDGTIPDGRVYVGTKSHHLDRPTPPRSSAQAPKHTYAFSPTQARPQGSTVTPQSLSQNRLQSSNSAQSPQQQKRQQAPAPDQGYNIASTQNAFSSLIRDEDLSDDERMSVATNRTARPRMSTPEENTGDPRFFQYNVGDGCHMVVAMYMERDASTALARFPGLARVRNDSSSSVKSVDQVTEIFRSAVIEEKMNITG